MPEAVEDDPAVQFYEANYTVLAGHILEVGKKLTLRDSQDGRCRFCGLAEPVVTFRKEAHAIPEALGNKSLFTAYECDTCNEAFGGGIENDLGNWTKPMRFVAQIRGKSGVPTLKKGSSGGWRVEMGGSAMEISQIAGEEEIAEVDELNQKLKLILRRDPFTPVAVAKALTKIAISVVPETELPNFGFALDWIRDTDHGRSPVSQAPLIQTFVPGPRPFENLMLTVLRRRSDALPVPYAIVVLAYGNETFQMTLPSPERDQVLAGKEAKVLAFPTPYHLGLGVQGEIRRRVIDLSRTSVIKGETVPVVFGFRVGERVQG